LSSTRTIVRRSVRAFFYCAPSLLAKFDDGVVVAFTGQSRGLLRTEPELLSKNAVNVRDAVADAESSPDHLGDALECPQIVRPSPGARTANQDRAKSPQIVLRQPRLPTGLRLRIQSLLALAVVRLSPAHHRRWNTVHLFRDAAHRQAVLPQHHGSPPSDLKLLLAARWSHPICRSSP